MHSSLRETTTRSAIEVIVVTVSGEHIHGMTADPPARQSHDIWRLPHTLQRELRTDCASGVQQADKDMELSIGAVASAPLALIASTDDIWTAKQQFPAGVSIAVAGNGATIHGNTAGTLPFVFREPSLTSFYRSRHSST
jgi:hypothetical protein